MESSDWSNALRYHTTDTRFDTEFTRLILSSGFGIEWNIILARPEGGWSSLTS
jgi:hypothetical protein